MGVKTGISWTDSTWNALRGCTRVSEGCRNCYAESVAYRFSGEGLPYEGLAVLKNGHPSWTGKVDWIDEHWEDPLRWIKPRRIFVNSMSDLFHERVPDLWIDDMFAVMQHAQSRGHIFQILTKRPERMLEYFSSPNLYERWLTRVDRVRANWQKFPVIPLSDPKKFSLKNVWLGVSAENQKTADERIPLLVQTPAAVRFVSAEPLLGPIDFQYMRLSAMEMAGHWIDWMIVGGESGPHARPMLSQWADGIREQCEEYGTKYFHKQNGEFIDVGHEEFGRLPAGPLKYLRSNGTEWPAGKVPFDEDADVNTVKRVGRKRAGDTLYGKVYHEFPA